jgi:acetyl esterase
MSLDPQAILYLEAAAAAGLPPLHTLTANQARAAFLARGELGGPRIDLPQVVDLRLLSGVVVRLYRPIDDPRPLPMIVYCHGGGWVLGSCDTIDATMRRLARGSGCVVASIDYRLAPEHQFPVPVHDCYHAARELIERAGDFGVDPRRVAIGGDSAGGNLAAAALLLGRRLGPLPIRAQLLVYPVTDCRFDTASYSRFAEGHGLTRDAMRWFWGQYLPDVNHGADPLASPLREPDLAGLPPAVVVLAGCDVLHDEAEAYALRLRQASVPVTILRYPEMIHGFFNMGGVMDRGIHAIEQAAVKLVQHFI